jgi:hypothetical protein
LNIEREGDGKKNRRKEGRGKETSERKTEEKVERKLRNLRYKQKKECRNEE